MVWLWTFKGHERAGVYAALPCSVDAELLWLVASRWHAYGLSSGIRRVHSILCPDVFDGSSRASDPSLRNLGDAGIIGIEHSGAYSRCLRKQAPQLICSLCLLLSGRLVQLQSSNMYGSPRKGL